MYFLEVMALAQGPHMVRPVVAEDIPKKLCGANLHRPTGFGAPNEPVPVEFEDREGSRKVQQLAYEGSKVVGGRY